MSRPHLNACERYAIEQLTLYGLSDREIGRRLGRSHTTIGRERVRNGPRYTHPTAVYVGRSADQFAKERRCIPRNARRRRDGRVWTYVHRRLERGWSPEQIAGRMRRYHPGSARMRIAPETIYRWIYRDAAEGGELYRQLRRLALTVVNASQKSM